MKYTTLILLLLSVVSFGQTHRISKVLETNLFRLDNDQKVRLYGLYIPALNDTNKIMSETAAQLYKWEKQTLQHNDFEFEFLKVNEDSTLTVKAYVRYPKTRYNLAGHFLVKGFAAISSMADSTFYSEIAPEQERAQYFNYGIWKNDLIIKDFLVVPSSGIFEDNNYNRYIVPFSLFIVTLIHLVLIN